MEEILPIHTVTDRKVKSLRLNIELLEAELTKITQGQLVLDEKYDESVGF